MNKSQIRFAMAAHAAWLVMKNPVLTRVYMEQWEKLYPRPLSVEGEELTLYGYVFQVMYLAQRSRKGSGTAGGGESYSANHRRALEYALYEGYKNIKKSRRNFIMLDAQHIRICW